MPCKACCTEDWAPPEFNSQPARGTLDRGVAGGTGKHVAICFFGKLHKSPRHAADAIPARAKDAYRVPPAAGFNARSERGLSGVFNLRQAES